MARVIFPTIEAARAASPFFIDEHGVGIWLETADPTQLTLGRAIDVVREAIHLPTLTRGGNPVPPKVQTEALARARELGLSEQHPAEGYWTLSTPGDLQHERVTIAFSLVPIAPAPVRALARWLLQAADQDAVAIEVGGRVEHIVGA